MRILLLFWELNQRDKKLLSIDRKFIALKMQGTEFLVELYILPLAGCDVVLGIHWLRMLGPILWDFATLSMEFEYADHKCVLRGLQQGKPWSLESAETFLKFPNKMENEFFFNCWEMILS
jgi:hypothetical protein